MKSSFNEIAIFFSGYFTLSMDANAARMADHLAHHMLGQFIARLVLLLYGELRIGFPTYWPFGYVVGPFVRVYASRSIAKSGEKRSLLNLTSPAASVWQA